MSYFQAPYSPYDATDKSGYRTVLNQRWPIILTSVIDNIHCTNPVPTQNVNDSLTVDADNLDGDAKERAAEGKRLLELVNKLKREIRWDGPLVQLPDDDEPGVKDYNYELRKLAEEEKGTWFTAPWLFAEYRLLRAWFAQTKQWRDHDPFLVSKEESFKGNADAVFELASMMHNLEARKDELDGDPGKIGIFVGDGFHAERKEFLLRDDSDAVWSHLTTMTDGRVDFILDNYLVFADFLVTYTPYVSKVVFHPKAIPWFVSDVTPPDFKRIFSSILSPSFHPPPSQIAPITNSPSDLNHMVTRWQTHLSTGAFSLSVSPDTTLGVSNPKTDFWTAPHPYWDMKLRAADLFEELSGSGLVIFKVNLFFEWLTGDVRWPVSTPFETAIGPLSGAFPILSLRTIKVDVVVGIDQAKADALDASGEKWRVIGKYALVSFCPRAA
ncbi:DUF89 domain-containing protein [Rickenella mellea]|uniref:Sugar phosphate phosphatase n=1 Tax=Rickenella mellea TaxID=50990 RepID=A0A4Y7Q7H8_9AGAM|nr:DUF89 domain-containing protein [Rickenella mellea]